MVREELRRAGIVRMTYWLPVSFPGGPPFMRAIGRVERGVEGRKVLKIS